MSMKNKKGFTLVEMLVVVAIIGLLAGVVLTSVGPARSRAKDARVISGLTQVRAIAETLYDGDYDALPGAGGSATLVSDTEANFGKTAKDIKQNSGGLYIDKASAPSTIYAAYSVLPSDPNKKYWCVDSTGASRQLETALDQKPNGQGTCCAASGCSTP